MPKFPILMNFAMSFCLCVFDTSKRFSQRISIMCRPLHFQRVLLSTMYMSSLYFISNLYLLHIKFMVFHQYGRNCFDTWPPKMLQYSWPAKVSNGLVDKVTTDDEEAAQTDTFLSFSRLLLLLVRAAFNPGNCPLSELVGLSG